MVRCSVGIEAGVTEDGHWELVTRLSVYEKSLLNSQRNSFVWLRCLEGT